MTNWATPTVFDANSVQKKLKSVVKHATGIRKGRSGACNLNEQVCYPWMTRVYALVKQHPEIENIESFIQEKLEEEGWLFNY